MRSLLLFSALLLSSCATKELHADQAEATQEYTVMQLTALDGSPFDRSLIDGSVILYVNVASECGLTPQYEQLQALYEKLMELERSGGVVECVAGWGPASHSDPASVAWRGTRGVVQNSGC